MVVTALIFVASLCLLAWVFRWLMRWARSGSAGTHAFGAVLTEVTQSAVVREAKQGKKRGEKDAGDPANDES